MSSTVSCRIDRALDVLVARTWLFAATYPRRCNILPRKAISHRYFRSLDIRVAFLLELSLRADHGGFLAYRDATPAPEGASSTN
jgi:hypothetical protein